FLFRACTVPLHLRELAVSLRGAARSLAWSSTAPALGSTSELSLLRDRDLMKLAGPYVRSHNNCDVPGSRRDCLAIQRHRAGECPMLFSRGKTHMFIANLIRIIFTCVALVCGIMVALFAHADIFSLDPRATYLPR